MCLRAENDRLKLTCLRSKRSPWKRQTKEIRNRVARWCEGGGHSSLSTLSLYPPKFQTLCWWHHRGPAPALLEAFYRYTSKWLTHVSQIYYPIRGGSFSGRLAIPLVLARWSMELWRVIQLSSALQRKTFPFWNYIVTYGRNDGIKMRHSPLFDKISISTDGSPYK